MALALDVAERFVNPNQIAPRYLRVVLTALPGDVAAKEWLALGLKII
jgi:hypothetical protein